MNKDDRLAAFARDLLKVELAVKAYQLEHGLAVDGDPGRRTLAQVREDLNGETETAPIPRNRREVFKVYGRFTWAPVAGRRILPDGKWVRENIRRYQLHNGDVVRMHRLAGPEFVRLFELACEASDYTPESVQTFNPRRIKADPDSPLSMHSWGIAVDFDPRQNAMGARNLESPGEPCPLVAHPEFLQVFRDAGWRVGHDWKMQDTMHIERRAP